uniref:Thioredoxin domain-containing protein n=1 Tax=Chrysotila carterae TaxID=13221 RepID=A0A7S4C0F8_CHRCT|mmetsp:Transcript_35415/g.74346  ORF Transcript_35415/g.74346 Transcript_35415/m.74346 type:complete len:219 (-) Transcript_35415:73-729(-)
MRLCNVFPDFESDSTKGTLRWYDYTDGHWSMLSVLPSDFTAVGTTELGSLHTLKQEFEKRRVKLATLVPASCESLRLWIGDVLAASKLTGDDLFFPMYADPTRHVAKLLDLVGDDDSTLSSHSIFVVGPDKRLKLYVSYPPGTGHNFGELLRTIDSLQLTASQGLATPANWKPGDACMVLPETSTAEVKERLAKGVDVMQVPSGKEYLRFTPDPRGRE